MTWPRRVASELFFALLVVGPPVVLVKIVGWPLHGWPTLEQARLWVAQPLTEQTLTAALTVLAWLVGLLVVYTVTVSVLTRIRAAARWLRRMPYPHPRRPPRPEWREPRSSASAKTPPPPRQPARQRAIAEQAVV